MLVLLSLALENFTCLDEERRRQRVVVSPLGCLLQVLYGLVELVQVGVGVAQGTFGGGADHLVAAGTVGLQCVDGLLPLAEVGLAESNVKLGQVAGIGRAVVVGYLLEERQCFLVLVFLEDFLGFGQLCAGFLLARLEIVRVQENCTHNDCDDGNHCNDDGLLVFLEEGFGLRDLLRLSGSLLLILFCHYSCCFYYLLGIIGCKGNTFRRIVRSEE